VTRLTHGDVLFWHPPHRALATGMSLHRPTPKTSVDWRTGIDTKGVPREKTILYSLLRVPSLWFIVAFTVLLVAEIPVTSGSFLEKFGAANLAGWLGQFVFLSLLIDALRGALPRAVALIPLLFYSGYYFAYWRQGVEIARQSQELRKTNPKNIIDFDPRSYSLVMEKADLFAATHAIPVVYTHDASFVHDEYVAYRLFATDTIKQYLSRNDDDVQVLSVYWKDVFQSNVRELRFPERPKHPILSVAVNDDPGLGWSDFNVGFETTSVSLESRVIGTFRSAYVRRLPIFPLFTVGCKFSSEHSKRTCDAEFLAETYAIESRPDSVDRTQYDDPISIMLGIKALSRSEIANFRGFSRETSPRAAPAEDEAFEALRAVIDGRRPALSWATASLISNDSSRLAPLALGMAKRFLALTRTNDAVVPGLREQTALLATGIAALEPAEFAGVQGQLADLAQRPGLREEYPLLYLRLADAGPKSFAIYRDQFLAQTATQQEKLLAALAICRGGQADSELLSVLRSEWSGSEGNTGKDDNYKSALFVALAKLGPDSLLRTSGPVGSKTLQGFYDAILSGRGKTDVGPNNCMPMEWPRSNVYVPPVMAPRLQWTRQQWRAGD
jgi:hypothetical protein